MCSVGNLLIIYSLDQFMITTMIWKTTIYNWCLWFSWFTWFFACSHRCLPTHQKQIYIIIIVIWFFFFWETRALFALPSLDEFAAGSNTRSRWCCYLKPFREQVIHLAILPTRGSPQYAIGVDVDGSSTPRVIWPIQWENYSRQQFIGIFGVISVVQD